MELPPAEALLDRLRSHEAGRILLERLPAGVRVHLVGGAVRDLLRNVPPKELDLVVEGDALDLARALNSAHVIAHDRFGTSTVRLGGHTYDLASARRERYEHPGALPTVAPAPLEQDLRRRDFTVNAIAIELPDGRLTALPGALDDLERQLLRVLHERSFVEDPTRLLRLARYASRLEFTIEPHTKALALDAVRGGALETVSGPRIGNELRLLALEPDPLAALARLDEIELDRAIHPDFGLADPARARRALKLLPADERRDLLVLAAASERVPPAELRALLDRLAFEASDRDRILAAASRAADLATALQTAARPSQIAAAIGGAPPELVALAGGHGASEEARSWLDELRHVELEIDGGDLIAAGVAAGPLIGEGLRAALAAKLDGAASTRAAELERALEAVR